MGKMTKQTVLECKALEAISANSLEPAQAYKAIKLKRLVKSNIASINEEIQEVYKDIFSDEEMALVAKVEQGQGSAEDIEKYKALSDKVVKCRKTIDEILKDEVDFDFAAFPFESWHNLTKENNLKLGATECDLEGVVFLAPEE